MALPFVPCELVLLDSMHDAASEQLSPFKTIIFDGPALHILLAQGPPDVRANAQTADVRASAQTTDVRANAQTADVRACAQTTDVRASARTADVRYGRRRC